MKFTVRWQSLALGLIIVLGLALRLYKYDWDQGNAFHPDERQILFTVMQFSWPQSWGSFFSLQSPLNPHFFAYGSFPMYLLALLAFVFHIPLSQPDSITALSYMGRILSALFDTGSILVTALLALRLSGKTQSVRGWNCALLAATLVAFTPLSLQLSHFFAVDTLLLFFVLLTLLCCLTLLETQRPILWSLLTGLSLGLALGTKFSATPLVVPILCAYLLRWYRQRNWLDLVSGLCFTAGMTIFIFVLVQPYALIDYQDFVQQLSDQGTMARGALDLPYVRQFAGTIPYLYELQNMVLWGLGLLLGIAVCFAFFWLLWRVARYFSRSLDGWLIVFSWVLVYGAVVGNFYVKYMRYVLPIYPFLILMVATFLTASLPSPSTLVSSARSLSARRWIVSARWLAIGLVLLGTIFQGLALLNVYSVPNTRLQASLWMYQHVPPGSVITYEQWDDALPYPIGSYSPNEFRQYTYEDSNNNLVTGLDLYDDDTLAKAHHLADALSQINVITMATDRLDKSIPRLPARYPLTIHYYQLLYNGQLGFHLAATFSNHPNLLGITLDDSNADESYSVFDHPTSRIFIRTTTYTADELFQKLMAGVHLPT